jgi:hypothetical protein
MRGRPLDWGPLTAERRAAVHGAGLCPRLLHAGGGIEVAYRIDAIWLAMLKLVFITAPVLKFSKWFVVKLDGQPIA